MGAYSKNKIINIVIIQNGYGTKLIWFHNMLDLLTIRMSVLLWSSFIKGNHGNKKWLFSDQSFIERSNS